MQLTNLSNLESAFIQTKLEATGIHYAINGNTITIIAPTPAQVAYVEGVVAVAIAHSASIH